MEKAAENLLSLKDYDDCMKAGKGIAPAEKDAKKLKKSKAILTLLIDKSLYMQIGKCANALEIWTTLKQKMISVRLCNHSSMQSYVLWKHASLAGLDFF